MLVADFKKLIFEKVKVPAERQRLVFGGKQLIDTNSVISHGKILYHFSKIVRKYYTFNC
jgi:hypothetical protein